MKIAKRVDELKDLIRRSSLVPVGIVPTMGALHDGHISLVKEAIGRTPLVVVSIYVNPTQFNDKSDFNGYPRTTKEDIEVLERVLRPDDILFLPSDEEIYPELDTRKFDFGNLDKVMEGSRRRHFNGVGQIVSKLLRMLVLI